MLRLLEGLHAGLLDSFFPLCLVPKGFSGQLPFVTAAHNRLTLAPQGLFGTSLVSFPYLSLKIAHRSAQA